MQNCQLDLSAVCNVSWGLFNYFQKTFSLHRSDMFHVSLKNLFVWICCGCGKLYVGQHILKYNHPKFCETICLRLNLLQEPLQSTTLAYFPPWPSSFCPTAFSRLGPHSRRYLVAFSFHLLYSSFHYSQLSPCSVFFKLFMDIRPADCINHYLSVLEIKPCIYPPHDLIFFILFDGTLKHWVV